MQKGGYLIISKTDADIYAKCKIALEQGKPILFYEADNTAYYIDTISGGEVTSEIVDDEEVFTYHDIVLTKGGKTITITSSNVVTESGNIQNHLYKYTIIKDDSGYSFICEILSKNDLVIDTFDKLLEFIGNEKHIATGLGDEDNGSVISYITTNDNVIKAYGYSLGDGAFYTSLSNYDVADSLENITITKTQLF